MKTQALVKKVDKQAIKKTCQETMDRMTNEILLTHSPRDSLNGVGIFRTGIMIFFILLTTLLYADSIVYLWDQWKQVQYGDYAHGLVVVPISMWMLVESLRKSGTKTPILAASLLIGFFSLCWAASVIMGIRLLENLSLYGILVSVVFTVGGFPLLQKSALGLLYLLVALPIWEQFLPLLQSIAAWISYFCLKLLPLTVIKEGAYISVPAGQFLVAEGCSGLRYLLAAMTFAGFFIYLESMRFKWAVVFTLSAIFAAIIANALRIVIVIIAGNMTAMQHAWVDEHMTLGWVVFAIMLIPVFWFGSFINKRSAPFQIENIGTINTQPTSQNKKKVIVTLAILGLFVGPLTLQWVSYMNENNVFNSHDESTHYLPENLDRWQRIESGKKAFDLGEILIGADHQFWQTYENRGEVIYVYQAIYHSQKQGKELINVENSLFNESLWQPMETRTVWLENEQGQIQETRVKPKYGPEVLIWTWYTSAGMHTTSGLKTKLYDLYGVLTNNTQASVTMLAVPITSKDEDNTQIRSALSEIVSSIQKEIK